MSRAGMPVSSQVLDLTPQFVDSFNDFEDDFYESEDACNQAVDESEGDPAQPISEKKAIQYIQEFFSYQTYPKGGPVPAAKLLIQEHIDWVRYAELVNCLILAHTCMEAKNWLNNDARTELIISLQNQSSALGIPKNASGGLLLIYLRVILGLELY